MKMLYNNIVLYIRNNDGESKGLDESDEENVNSKTLYINVYFNCGHNNSSFTLGLGIKIFITL